MNIEYFSDALCVWAYAAQPRLNQLHHDFPGQINLQYRFIPLFAAAQQRIEAGWGEQGGLSAFNRHILQLTRPWDHLEVNSKVWLENPPTSSTLAHLFLKAIQLLQEAGHISSQPVPEFDDRTQLEEAIWRVRLTFFRDAGNISELSVLQEIASQLQLPKKPIERLLDNGEAHAALHLDMETKEQYQVSGSPTLVFNEGRQKLYGNVGYRIIKANVQELFHNPQHGEASWC